MTENYFKHKADVKSDEAQLLDAWNTNDYFGAGVYLSQISKLLVGPVPSEISSELMTRFLN